MLFYFLFNWSVTNGLCNSFSDLYIFKNLNQHVILFIFLGLHWGASAHKHSRNWPCWATSFTILFSLVGFVSGAYQILSSGSLRCHGTHYSPFPLHSHYFKFASNACIYVHIFLAISYQREQVIFVFPYLTYYIW